MSIKNIAICNKGIFMRSASEMLDEIRRIKGLKSDAALGLLLGGVAQSTVASWRGRNSVPYDEIIAFCVKEGVSIDWLIKGEGKEPEKTALPPRTAALLDNYEALNEEDKRAFERLAFTVAQSQKITKKAG